MSYALGVIEGFFGLPWSWQQRHELIEYFQQQGKGYSFYIYGPKDDHYLREQWQQDCPAQQWQQLCELRQAYRLAGVEFGLSLAPIELHKLDTPATHPALKQKIARLNELELDILTIQFDDNHGAMPKLAQQQLDIVHAMAAISNAKKIIFCPTYYSDDPELIYAAGKMPEHYLEDIGQNLDPAIEVFWTGPIVCSKDYPIEHLQRVTAQLQRKPFIWDNYPVNDGPFMYSQLHLGAVKNRPAQLQDYTAGWAVNPMNQFFLSLIPMTTLLLSWQQGSNYQFNKAFLTAAQTLCEAELAHALDEDKTAFQSIGLKKFSTQQKQAYIQRYAKFDSPYAKEVLDWLQDIYLPSQAVIDEFEECNLNS